MNAMCSHEPGSHEDRLLVQQAIATVYGIGVKDVREAVRGVNRTFLVRDPADRLRFLRLYRTHGRREEEIEAELRLLAGIAPDDRLAASTAYPTLSGERSFRVALSDGVTRRAALFSAATGRPMEMTRHDLALAGNALRRLHGQAALEALCPRKHLAPIGEALCTLDRLFDEFAFSRHAAVATAKRFGKLMAAGWPPAYMPIGFCHGDFRLANMRNDGGRITLFDFDDCGCGPQWFDLATIGWWLETEGGADARFLWQAFVDAYMPALNHSPGFRHAIPLLVLLNEIRSIRFLLDYCVLSDEIWRDMCRRLDDLSLRAASARLAIDDYPRE